jgi:hypothetical protein
VAAQATTRESSAHVTLKSDARPRLFAVRIEMKRIVRVRTILLLDTDETAVVKKIIRVG